MSNLYQAQNSKVSLKIEKRTCQVLKNYIFSTRIPNLVSIGLNKAFQIQQNELNAYKSAIVLFAYLMCVRPNFADFEYI